MDEMAPDLLTIDEIAALLRAERRTVAEKWVHKPDFPRPFLAPTPRHRLWKREDILKWAQPAELVGQR
jgi:hypothetical protein